MKKGILLLSVFVSFAVLSGCSIYKAATAPSPVVLDSVKVGSNRISIVGALGVPKMSETKADTKVDVYEFVDGAATYSKSRIILYIAGDLFTAALSELVFWPIELGLGQGTSGRAVVTYGMDDIAKAVLLTEADGTPWKTAPVEETKPVMPVKTTNKVNSASGTVAVN